MLDQLINFGNGTEEVSQAIQKLYKPRTGTNTGVSDGLIDIEGFGPCTLFSKTIKATVIL